MQNYNAYILFYSDLNHSGSLDLISLQNCSVAYLNINLNNKSWLFS